MRRARVVRPSAGACALFALLSVLLPACSLISLKTPGKPLSQRELNTRLQTREYADSFQRTIAGAADQIAALSADPHVQLAALQWKVRSASASRHAATQMSPTMGLLDSWALSAQMQEFLSGGAGSALFGSEQGIARTAVAPLLQDIVGIARELSPPEDFAKYETFVGDYVRDAPLTSLELVRDSVVDRWTELTGQRSTLISTVGTAPEVVSDFADRLRLYGDHLPSETLWQAQLTLRQAGYGAQDWQRTMNRLNDSLGDVSRLAQDSPELLQGSVDDLRGILFDTTDRLDQSWMEMLRAMHVEREALAQNIQQERASVVAAVGVQRAAMMQDAERIAVHAVETSAHEVRGLIRELAAYAIVAMIVVLGLPFAAGYFLGWARARRPT
jgi:hypothetical protein